jgi:hypothetical protein
LLPADSGRLGQGEEMTFGSSSFGRKAAAILALVAVAAPVAAFGATGGGGDKSGAGERGSPPAASTQLPQGSERVSLKPADFTTKIDNPYWPMKPGSRWVYRETDAQGTAQRVVVTVTHKTKRIANGVKARVVHDVVTQNGKLVENTYDWYAQDKAGNVWYLGEATKEYENGKVKTTKGSWEAGVDGAQPGIIMPAKPKAGMNYRQEYYAGQAEDKARIVSTKEQAEVPAGHYKRVVMTRDVNPLSPKILEFKFYAKDVGPVLALSASGGSDREDLISYRPGR